MIRFPWVQARAALEAAAASDPKAQSVQVTYVNPETGADCQKILGFYALMLRPGEHLALPARSPGAIFHVIEGSAQVDIQDRTLSLGEADTVSAPGYARIGMRNLSNGKPCFLFIADEAPLQSKLGLYEVRG